jgi:hypothetical protein
MNPKGSASRPSPVAHARGPSVRRDPSFARPQKPCADLIWARANHCEQPRGIGARGRRRLWHSRVRISAADRVRRHAGSSVGSVRERTAVAETCFANSISIAERRCYLANSFRPYALTHEDEAPRRGNQRGVQRALTGRGGSKRASTRNYGNGFVVPRRSPEIQVADVAVGFDLIWCM